MITIEEARRIITEQIAPLPPVAVELSAATGRVLREDIAADGYYPPADRSMMDGYAIIGEDESERFRVVAEITPGKAPTFTLARGECARIFTGGILPRGATQVVMQEEARRDGEWMIATQRSERRFVRSRGEEAKPGDILLKAGLTLRPAELAILAQVGVTQPKVSPRPKVTHIATGEELIAPAEKPAGGQIRDTNSTLIRSLVEQCGAEISSHARLGDDLKENVTFASAHAADLLLISGGASVGDHDFGARTLRELGYTIHFDRVNLRPGKPLTFGTRGEHAAFVIPGNPVSHFVCFHVAVSLAIDCLTVRAPSWSFVNLPLGGAKELRRDARDTLWPAEIMISDNHLVATPKRSCSSGDTFSLAGTNALIRVVADASPGEVLPTLMLSLRD